MTKIRNLTRKYLASMPEKVTKDIADQQGSGQIRINAGVRRVRDAAGTESEEAVLYIMDDIGDSWWGECITGKDVAKFLSANRGKDVRVIMDCGGGDVFDGMTMMNSLLAHDGTVTGEITGLCYSAASYVILGCDTVTAHQTSMFGIHPCHTYTYGNQYAHADTIRWLDTIDNMVMDVYEKRTGMDRDELFALFKGGDNDGTVMSAKEAYDKGFIDDLVELASGTSGKASDKPTDQAAAETSPSGKAAPNDDSVESPDTAEADARRRIADKAAERARLLQERSAEQRAARLAEQRLELTEQRVG